MMTHNALSASKLDYDGAHLVFAELRYGINSKGSSLNKAHNPT